MLLKDIYDLIDPDIGVIIAYYDGWTCSCDGKDCIPKHFMKWYVKRITLPTSPDIILLVLDDDPNI